MGSHLQVTFYLLPILHHLLGHVQLGVGQELVMARIPDEGPRGLLPTPSTMEY